MINTVIFDIGNVLVNFGWRKIFEELFPNQSELYSQLGDIFVGSGIWDELDRGDDPEKVLAHLIAYRPSREKEIRAVFENIGQALSKRPEVPAWLKDLKARGKKILYLSNYSHYVMEANPEVLDFLPLMDGGVFSCDVHLIKPDRKIYACIAEKYNLVPSECVFIDDLERNVQAAKNFGFHGIQFVTLKQAQEDLNKLLQEE